jgi:hypothetical protein
MAARLNPRHQDSVREKIRATQIINALQNHVFGKKKMEPSQVTAGLGLLKKCVADLSNVEVTGKDGGPIDYREVVRKIV